MNTLGLMTHLHAHTDMHVDEWGSYLFVPDRLCQGDATLIGLFCSCLWKLFEHIRLQQDIPRCVMWSETSCLNWQRPLSATLDSIVEVSALLGCFLKIPNIWPDLRVEHIITCWTLYLIFLHCLLLLSSFQWFGQTCGRRCRLCYKTGEYSLSILQGHINTYLEMSVLKVWTHWTVIFPLTFFFFST